MRGREILRTSQRLGGSIGRGFTRKFIADSSALARVLVGWVYLLSSSSYSLLELLVGFPMAHPLLLSPYAPECVEEEFSEVDP